jgi:hypothetical protein
MDTEHTKVSESIQKLVVQVLAMNPPGEGLCLIGGFRYRLLDASCRRSLDLDYHCPGDLKKKQAEVVALLRKKLLPIVRERMGYDGSVNPATGPDADSAAVKTLEVAVWQLNGPLGRITIPVDITRIPCADKPIVRTVDGVVYLSASDADMVESKVLAMFLRPYFQERDMVDVFLFQDKFRPDSPGRMRKKLSGLAMPKARVSEMLKKIVEDRKYHVRNIEGIIRDQIDAPAAANMKKAGGAAMIFDHVLQILESRLRLLEGK